MARKPRGALPARNWPLRDRRILITGGAGFVGSHLVEALAAENELVIYDSFARNSLGGGPRLPRTVRIVRGDVLDQRRLRRASEDVDLLIHLAAIAGIETVTRSPLATLRTNLLGTYNALEAATAAGVHRFLYASTSEVYGPYVFLGKESDMTTQGPNTEPRWTYSTSKLAGEHFVQSYHRELGLGTIILRLFNVYGPRQTGEGAMHNFIVAALRNKPLLIFGSGLQVRAWCYVSDALDAFLRAAQSQRATGMTFNVGNPSTAISILALAHRVVELLGSRSKIVETGRVFADVALRVPDIQQAGRVLGFHPKVSLNEGIRRTTEWYRRALGG